MKKLEFKIIHSGHEYLITHSQTGRGGRAIVIEGPNLYEWANDGLFYEDFEPVEKVWGHFDGKGAVIGSDSYALIGGEKVKSFELDNEIVGAIIASIAEDYNTYQAKEKDIEAHRLAPYIDKNKLETFCLGYDSGYIAHDNAKAITLALRNGAKRYKILAGLRASTNKYPGKGDLFIPEDFAQKVQGKYEGKGYRYLYVERYGILKVAYQKALEELEVINMV